MATNTQERMNPSSEGHDRKPQSMGITPELRGWASVQDTMKRHDAAVVKDFADDINTLLVFAGLFSAIVTAFVVESYKWLQQDNSQTTVQLLSGISLQLGGFTIKQAFINSTEPPILSLPPFKPAPILVAINILWFLCLVFSLAAALFGMLAKQWLREYLRWDSILSDPQENVRLRQQRFQAWNDWGVANKIYAIPALLEIALVLFLCGVIAFLWTLHHALALAITVSVAIILLVTFFYIVLPTFSRSCPYKSPTGWAITSLYARLYWGGKFAIETIGALQMPCRWRDYYVDMESWRHRDVYSSFVEPSGDEIKMMLSQYEHRNDKERILVDIIKLPLLLQALISACGERLDTVWSLIAECTPTLYQSNMASARFLATLHAVRKAISPEQDFFVQFKENIIYHAPTGKFGVVFLSSNIDEAYNKLKDAFGTGSTPNGPSLLILADVLSDSLTRFISDTFSTGCDLISPPLLLALVEGLLLQSGLIRLMTTPYRSKYALVMEKLYRHSSRISLNDVYYKGLRTIFLQLLGQFGELHYTPGEGDDSWSVLFTNPLDSEDYITEPKEYALAATRLCESNLKQEHLRAEDRHMFVVMANMAFLPNRLVLPGDESSKMERLRDLLQSMTTVSRTALDRGWTNCGAHMDLPWVDALVKGIKESSQQPSPLVPLIPPALLDNIGESIQQGLISGKNIKMQYNELLKFCQ